VHREIQRYREIQGSKIQELRALQSDFISFDFGAFSSVALCGETSQISLPLVKGVHRNPDNALSNTQGFFPLSFVDLYTNSFHHLVSMLEVSFILLCPTFEDSKSKSRSSTIRYSSGFQNLKSCCYAAVFSVEWFVYLSDSISEACVVNQYKTNRHKLNPPSQLFGLLYFLYKSTCRLISSFNTMIFFHL